MFSSPHPTLAALAVVTVGLLTVPATAQGESHVQATLTTSITHFRPGLPFTAAVTLNITPQWHVYWINPGDSGLPTEITWKLPPGWTAGPLQYPVPNKFNQPGDILGYGYESTVTLLTEITPSAAASTAPAEITAKLTYLVCHDICLPGSAKLTAKLPPAVDSGSPTLSPSAPAIAQAKQLLPAAQPITPQVTATRQDKLITLQARLAIPLDGTLPHDGTWQLFPFPDDNLEWQSPTAAAEAGDILITARIRQLAASPIAAARALLVHTSPAGKSSGWEIILPIETNQQRPAGR